MAGKGPRSFGEFDAGLHGMIAHELHDLRAELLAFLRAITHAHVIHQVGQTHDAETDAAGLCAASVSCGTAGT